MMLPLLLCLLAMGTLHVSGQPDVDGSGTFLALQAPVGFPAIHLVGLASECERERKKALCPSA